MLKWLSFLLLLVSAMLGDGRMVTRAQVQGDPDPAAALVLVVREPTEAHSTTDEVLWIAQPGDLYAVLLLEEGRVFVAGELDGPDNAVWIARDGRIDLSPGRPGAGLGLAEPLSTATIVLPTTRGPSPTPTPVPPGAILLQDAFDDPSAGVLPRTVVRDAYQAQYLDGEYQIRNTGNTASITVRGVYTDVSIAVDVRMIGGPTSRAAYVSCRRDYDPDVGFQGYLARVYPGSQRFVLVKSVGRAVQTLLDLPSTAIRSGEASNRLELRCAGNTISLSINGTLIGSVNDASARTGELIMGINGVGAEGRFDNLVVTQR